MVKKEKKVSIKSVSKAGRKPVPDKKTALTIYRPKSEYEKLGGRDRVRKYLNDAVDKLLSSGGAKKKFNNLKKSNV